jgi:hypothetical protein
MQKPGALDPANVFEERPRAISTAAAGQQGVHTSNRASTTCDENDASWVACPVSDALRGKFESYLDAQPDLDEASALARLLERGLQGVEDQPIGSKSEGEVEEQTWTASRGASIACRRRSRRRAMLRRFCAKLA